MGSYRPPQKGEQIHMSNKVVYVGPTIIGVATRNTTYNGIPEPIAKAAESGEAPYLLSLCVPVKELANALAQINRKEGYIWTFYNKALTYKVGNN